MNILLTSVGRRSYLIKYFKEALGDLGKIYASNSVKSIATQEADDYLITPLIYDDNYIPVIIDFCIKNNITAVMSVFDIDLLVLSKNASIFEENGIRLILADQKAIEICNDKWETFLFLKKNNIKTPKSYLSVDDVLKSIENSEISYPVVIKPRWGMASLGIYMVDNEDELRVLSKKCKKEIFDSHLKFESSFTPDESIIYQEKLNGQEYGLDVINDLEGNYVTTFSKKKILMRAGETDLGETVSSLPFINIAQILSHEIKHQAILSVDCFIVKDEIFVIEMNCRISGHYPLSHLAGVDLPKQIVLWLQGKQTDLSLIQFKENLFIIKDLVPKIISV